MNNTNVKESRNSSANKANNSKANNSKANNSKANNSKANNDIIIFPKLTSETLDNSINEIATNIAMLIEYCKKLASDKEELAKQEQANKSNETLIANMLKNKQITEEQASKLKETMITPINASNWDKYPISSSKYDSFYQSFNVDKSTNEDCLQSLTLFFMQARASIYALSQFKQYISNINENSNIITDILNKDNVELFLKRCNSQSKRSGQNYKLGKECNSILETYIEDKLK